MTTNVIDNNYMSDGLFESGSVHVVLFKDGRKYDSYMEEERHKHNFCDFWDIKNNYYEDVNGIFW